MNVEICDLGPDNLCTLEEEPEEDGVTSESHNEEIIFGCRSQILEVDDTNDFPASSSTALTKNSRYSRYPIVCFTSIPFLGSSHIAVFCSHTREWLHVMWSSTTQYPARPDQTVSPRSWC